MLEQNAPMVVLVEQHFLVERADPGFWNPEWAKYQDFSPNLLRKLGDYIQHITYGPIVTGEKPHSLGKWENGVLIVGQTELTDTFLDLSGAVIVEEGSKWDAPRAQLKYRDILFPRSGVGSLGKFRFAVWLERDPQKKVVVDCFTDIVRVDTEKVFPEYIAVYLKCIFGLRLLR